MTITPGAPELTDLLREAPGDATEHEAVRKFIHGLAEAGLSVLFISPGSKLPADMRSSVAKNKANREAREAARADGKRGWQNAKSAAGLALATTDTAVLDGYLDRYIRTFSKWADADGNQATWSKEAEDAGEIVMTEPVAVNLAVEVGGSGLVVVDCDTAAQTATFLAEAEVDPGTAPTVRSPGATGTNGDPDDPDTWAHSDGGHYWFTVPKDVELPGSMGAMTWPGDDGFAVLWDRRYVLIPPSVRPEGAYVVAGAVKPLPDWLRDAIIGYGQLRAERARDRPSQPTDGDLAARIDAWAETVSWAEILEPFGWVLMARPDSCGCETWTAPGDHADPKSATAHDAGCTDGRYTEVNAPLHIWTDHDRPPFDTWLDENGKSTISKLRAVAAGYYENDVGAAMHELGLTDSDQLRPPAEEVELLNSMYGTTTGDGAIAEDDELDGSGPGGLFVDIAAILEGGGTPKAVPSVLRRTDGRHLFYAGKANLLFGDPETAKTWIALAAGAEELDAGGRFVFIDMDHNGVDTTLERLIMMGVSHAVLADPNRFLYVEPDDRDHLGKVITYLVGWKPGVALLDSVGELLPLVGLNSNQNDEVTNAFNYTAGVLAKAGAAVILIDHLAKNTDSRRLGPVGAFAKTRIFNGAMIRAFRTERFIRGQGGVSSLWAHKDRPGGVLVETAPPNKDDDDKDKDRLRHWGTFHMISTPVRDESGAAATDGDGYPLETLTWEVRPPKDLNRSGDGQGEADRDPRKGGRPRGGETVVGSAEYNTAIRVIATTLVERTASGHITIETDAKGRRKPATLSKDAARVELVLRASGDGDDPKPYSRIAFGGGWRLWLDAGCPESLTNPDGTPTIKWPTGRGWPKRPKPNLPGPVADDDDGDDETETGDRDVA